MGLVRRNREYYLWDINLRNQGATNNENGLIGDEPFGGAWQRLWANPAWTP